MNNESTTISIEELSGQLKMTEDEIIVQLNDGKPTTEFCVNKKLLESGALKYLIKNLPIHEDRAFYRMFLIREYLVMYHQLKDRGDVTLRLEIISKLQEIYLSKS